VLLLDEPLSALDAKVRTTLRDQIRRIQTEVGITTLFVTHDQEEALGISDRVGVMSHGQLEQLGTPTEVYRTPSTAFVARFVGSMNELPASVLGNDAVDVLGHAIPIGSTNGHRVGAAVCLLVRPEDLRIVGGSDGLAGTVTAVTFQGAATIVGVRLDVLDTLVSAHLAGAGADDIAPGARVMVAIDGTRAVVETVTPDVASDSVETDPVEADA